MRESYRMRFLDSVAAFNGNTYAKGKVYDIAFFEAETFKNDNLAVFEDESAKPKTPEEIAAEDEVHAVTARIEAKQNKSKAK